MTLPAQCKSPVSRIAYLFHDVNQGPTADIGTLAALAEHGGGKGIRRYSDFVTFGHDNFPERIRLKGSERVGDHRVLSYCATSVKEGDVEAYFSTFDGLFPIAGDYTLFIRAVQCAGSEQLAEDFLAGTKSSERMDDPALQSLFKLNPRFPDDTDVVSKGLLDRSLLVRAYLYADLGLLAISTGDVRTDISLIVPHAARVLKGSEYEHDRYTRPLIYDHVT